MESSTSLPLATENAQPIGTFTIGGGCIEGQIIQVNGVDRYRVVGSDCSVVADLITGLEWQRCSVGQTWNASTQSCDGFAGRFTWDAALTQTASGGFRLPTLGELRSLVYCSNTGMIGMYEDWPVYCGGTYDGFWNDDFQTLTIVQEAFPSTDNWAYWSSSTYADDPDLAWDVYFNFGSVYADNKANYYHVRLVRGGQSLAFLPSALATRQDPLLSPKAASALLASELPPALQRWLSDTQAPLSSPHASADGRLIIFATEAALLPEDDNGVSDIYRFDATRNQLQRLSVGLNGQPANAASHSPRLDASGQRVVFLSAATNLTPGLPGKADQLYLHDDAHAGLVRLSETPLGEPADAAITHPLIDAAGEQVVYRSAAANLDAGPGLYRHNLHTGLREVIAVDDQGQPDPHADAPAADATLALIAYQRPVPEGPVADVLQVYLYDPARNLTERISPFFNEYGQAVANCCASLSPDGAYLAWQETTADGERRLIVLDRATGRWIPQPWPQDAALAEQAPVFGNANRELWWMNSRQGPGSEPVLYRLPNLLMEAAK